MFRPSAAKLLLILAIIVTAALPASAARFASIVVNERTGAVLHAVNPDARSYPASLAKMMTLYLIFEGLRSKRLSLEQELVVSRRAQRRPKSRLGLKAGDTITVSDAIGALITKSANDVATAVAEAMAGTEERFAEIMTVRANQLGMFRTTFRNASGLYHREQVTTVRDMARLAIALRRDFPEYMSYFAMESFTFRGRAHRNHNRLLKRFKGTSGLKTGYVRASGFNIAVSVERDGEKLIGVVFGGKTAGRRDRQMIRLLQRTLDTLAENKQLQKSNPVVAKATNPVTFAGIMPAPRREADDDEDPDAWSVQVGAFERFAPAHLAATRATRLAPGLTRARVQIDATADQGGRIYRARLVGLSEESAQQACDTLKKKQISCLVVRTESETAQGDR